MHCMFANTSNHTVRPQNGSQCTERAFSDEGGPFDFVFNLVAETKYSQSPKVRVVVAV